MHDSQRLALLVQALQNGGSCHGFEEVAQRNHVRDRRTLYRMMERFGMDEAEKP